MDELCKLLADKLGIVADASASWLQTAIPQYAEMMAIQTTFWAICAIIGFIFTTLLLIFLWRREDFSVDAIAISLPFIGFEIMFVVLALMFTPEAICWHVTPDAMLLRELIGVVK